MNIKINHTLSHLPLEVARGSKTQRLDSAIEATNNFFGNIKAYYNFYGDITPKEFVNVLKRTAKTKDIFVRADECRGIKQGALSYNINFDNAAQEGYVLYLPTSDIGRYTYDYKIPKTATPVFMKVAFSFFNRIFNPKFIKRDLVVNQYDVKKYKDFFQSCVRGTKNFTKEDLQSCLQSCSPQEKIDVLQLFRYHMTEQIYGDRLANKCKKEMDRYFKTKTLERFPSLKIKAHDYQNKIKIVEAELAEILKNERARLTKS